MANHRCYLWTEALSAKVFVPAQKLSGVVWTWPQANRTKTAARTSKQQHEQLIFWAKQLLCTCITILCTIFRRPLHDYEVKLLDVKLWRTWKHGEKISFLTLKLDTALKNYLRLTNWEKLNKGDLKEHKSRPLSIAHHVCRTCTKHISEWTLHTISVFRACLRGVFTYWTYSRLICHSFQTLFPKENKGIVHAQGHFKKASHLRHLIRSSRNNAVSGNQTLEDIVVQTHDLTTRPA